MLSQQPHRAMNDEAIISFQVGYYLSLRAGVFESFLH